MNRESHSEAVPLTLIGILIIFCLIDASAHCGAAPAQATEPPAAVSVEGNEPN
jgi:hypothetical protein